MSGEEIRTNVSVDDEGYSSILLFISENLYPSLEKFKCWANNVLVGDLENATTSLPGSNPPKTRLANATELLFKLDEKGIISASDLRSLKNFFESIERYDLVHIIDLFHESDYAELNSILPNSKKSENLVSSQDRGNSDTAASATSSDVSSTDPGRSTSLLDHTGTSINRCTHFERRCYVKFACCDTFWPCHFCHNSRSTCGRRNLGSSNTEMVKCVNCGKVQEVSQSCSCCGEEFARYHCQVCKYFCGREDGPYHCETCGICSERSFHCDGCDVCMNVKHCGNHRCREGPAHDEGAFADCEVPASLHDQNKAKETTGDLPDFPLFKELIFSNLSISDVVKFMDWARKEFSLNAENAVQVLFGLKVSDLYPTRDFFQSEGKFDLVHIVDKFLEGDCKSLRAVQSAVNRRVEKSENRTRMSDQDSNPGTSGGQTGNTNDPPPSPNLSSDSSINRVATQSAGTSTGDFSTDFSLCSHYRRKCYVKFDCCDMFWPCHRCHNNQSLCGIKNLKSRDISTVRCLKCGKVQQFSHSCSSCSEKFSDYYCGPCKHLSGTEDDPYHCEKCGICRIHKNRSSHCDIYGVCLDVQQRENHECHEASAFDKCCVCVQDAFTEFHKLPCSHRVHRECENHIRRNGIRRCPICRGRFSKGGQMSTTNYRRRNSGN